MSDFRRFFVENISDRFAITGEEFRHAVNVLRIREGETVIICDNSGFEYLAKIVKISKKDFEVEIFDKRMAETEPKNKVVLIAGYLKGDKTELIVQKAVELGIKEIIVFSSKFSSAYMNDNKLERLNKVSVEAAKQCGRAFAPSVIYCDTFDKALIYGKKCKYKLFACEFADCNQADISKLNGDCAIVVGSEGGFSKDEAKTATDNGYEIVYLGKRILRAETACIALSSIVMHALGEM